MTNKNGIKTGQVWAIKHERDRIWRDSTIEVSSVSFEYFKDEYNREWGNDLLMDNYILVEE